MSCDYPCHICDPEDWEENPPRDWEDLQYDVERAYDGALKNLERVFSKLGYAEGPPPGYVSKPIWWELMDEWPDGVYITEENDYDDSLFYGGTLTRVLTNSYIYMERKRSQNWLDNAGVDRFPIRSYLTYRDPVPHIAAVLSSTPPPWGWWMPSLKEEL